MSLAPPSSVPPAPPTLSKPAGSLIDALKKPEYQIENIRKEAKQKSDLSPSTASPPVGRETKGLSVPPLKPLKDVPLIVPTSNWSCDSCWVSNKSDTNKCVACGDSQPSGIKKKAVAFSTPSVTDTSSGGLKLPTGGSLTSTSGGLKLPTDNLTGGVKLPQGGNVMLAPSGVIFSSSGPPTSTSTSTSIASSSGSGLKLSSGGLSTNIQPPTLITPAVNTKPTATPLSSLAPPTSTWECPICMLHNDPSKDSCPACETPRPGAATKTSQTSLNSSVKPVQFGDGGGMKLGGGGVLLAGVGNKPTLPIASGGGLKLGGGGLNIFGGISSQSQSVSTSNTITSQSVTLGGTTQSTITTSSHTNVFVSMSPDVSTGSSLLSSSSLSTAPSLLPPAATKPSLFGQSPVTIAPPPLSTGSSATPPLSLGGGMSVSSNLTSTVGAPLFMQSQQPVSGPSTTFMLPKSDFNKGTLSGLKFEAPPPPVLTTASSEGTSQSQPISVAPSSGFSTLPTTSVGASLFQSFLTPPPVSTATMFGKPPGGGDGQKLLFGVPNQG